MAEDASLGSSNDSNRLVKLYISDLGPHVWSYLTLRDALLIEETAKALAVRDGYFKDALTSCVNNRGKNAPVVDLSSSTSARDLYKGVWHIHRRVHLEQVNLMAECFEVSEDIVRSCSSTDRAEESPKNVLQKSFCQDIMSQSNMLGQKVPEEEATITNLTPMAHAQIRCGCATSAACYYCCKASPTANMKEFINMSLSRFAYLSTHPRTRRQRRQPPPAPGPPSPTPPRRRGRAAPSPPSAPSLAARAARGLGRAGAVARARAAVARGLRRGEDAACRHERASFAPLLIQAKCLLLFSAKICRFIKGYISKAHTQSP